MQSPTQISTVRSVLVAGQLLDVFTEWADLCPRMIADIAAARRRVWVEVYIFHDDRGGRAVAEALIERAKAGLDVRVLADAIGSQQTPAAFWGALRQAGVKVHIYRPLWEALTRWRRFVRFNRRNHRKLMVLDDKVGYFGGMNIIDTASAAGAPAGGVGGVDLPASAGWRDVHIRIEGDKVADLANSFEHSWRRAQAGEQRHSARGRHTGTQARSRREMRALLADLRGAAGGPEGDMNAPRVDPNPTSAAVVAAQKSIRFFDSGPGLRHSRAARLFAALLHQSRQRVTLSMAYFIPIGSVLRALLSARRRCVRIRVIIPGKSDVPLVQRATMHLYSSLLHRGFRVYERRDRMLHSKVLVMDGLWSVVGSCNLDPQSLTTNLEFLAVVRSREFAKVIEEVCREEMKASHRVRLSDCGKMGWWDRVLNRVAWTFRRWL